MDDLIKCWIVFLIIIVYLLIVVIFVDEINVGNFYLNFVWIYFFYFI